MTDATHDEAEIRPFPVDVPLEDLDDLRGRLGRTRWPGEVPGAGWDHGGHFAAMEVPELLVDDVRAFFRGLR